MSLAEECSAKDYPTAPDVSAFATAPFHAYPIAIMALNPHFRFER